MTAIVRHPHPRNLTLKTVVTGTHLTLGTWRDMKDAGFSIDARVPMQQRDQAGRAADVHALGRGIVGLGQTLGKIQPDVVLILGDRIEALAAACAASVGGYHLGHLHGGDRAAGVADEANRHAISKMAHLHFPATASSRRRLIRMGEQPQNIHHVGSPAVDGLRRVKADRDAPQIIVMQHPVGGTYAQEQQWMRQTLKATHGYTRVVMAPNRDPGCDGIHEALRQAGVPVVNHLPRPRFLSMLAGAEMIVGNSSAGLIEAAVFRRPCVNIGPRQSGRQRPANVIDCAYGTEAVRVALNAAQRLDLRRSRHPYGCGDTGVRVAQILAYADLSQIQIRKKNVY